MALTMTRTRTQTALTKLANLVANIHGELEFIERLLEEMPEHQESLEVRKTKLLADRDALYLALKQFDPELEPEAIGTAGEWAKQYGRRSALKAIRLRYIQAISFKY